MTEQRPDRSLTGAQLADLVRERGGAGFDVRLLVGGGPPAGATIQAMARELDRDVLVAPAGSTLTYRSAPADPGPGPADVDVGTGVDVVPVDLVTGYSVDWVAVRPTDDGSTGPTWFELTGGLVLPRAGLSALALPGGGLSLATRGDFVHRRSAAAALRPGHPNMLTVAVAVRSGEFVVGDYGGRVSLCDGRQLAAVLASIPLYGRHLRMWLAWPDSLDEGRRLATNLARLASVTGATVWAPAEGGRVEFLDGCRDLAVAQRDARPGRWDVYGDPAGAARFKSDVDGRLVPAGGTMTTSYPGVPLVSVPAAHEQDRLARYDRLRPSQTVFRADLAVLADGRLALRYRDGTLLAAGERQTRQLLEIAGWRGADLMLLSAVSPEQAAGAWAHAERLGRYLRCAVTLSEVPRPNAAAGSQVRPGTEAVRVPVPVPVPGRAEAVPVPVPGPAVPVPVPVPGRAEAVPVPRVVAVPVAVAIAHTPNPVPPVVPSPSSVRVATASTPVPAAAPPPPPSSASRFIDGPRLMLAQRSSAWHGLTWLHPQPQVNAEACELFVECEVDPDVAAIGGIPSSGLFLLGHLDAACLGARTRAGHLLALRVEPGAAVDAAASEAVPPPVLAPALRCRDVYVLPVGWLDRCHLVAALRVGPAGGVVARRRFADVAVKLTSRGAAHGVAGVPNEVQRWPQGRLQTSVVRFVMVDTADGKGLGPWQRLYRQRPPAAPGHRLLEIAMDRDRAIDIAGTARALAPLTRLHTILPQLLADGTDYVLPVASYPYVYVEREFLVDNGGWRRSRSAVSRTLEGWRPAPD